MRRSPNPWPTGLREPSPAEAQETGAGAVGETSPGEHFDGEEVGTCQDPHVTGDEILPGGILAPLGRRLDPVSAKGIAHRLIGNAVAEIGQGSDDAVVSPAGVLSGEAHNERFQLGRDAGPARRST